MTCAAPRAQVWTEVGCIWLTEKLTHPDEDPPPKRDGEEDEDGEGEWDDEEDDGRRDTYTSRGSPNGAAYNDDGYDDNADDQVGWRWGGGGQLV